jgi:hypothetical protein
LTTIFGPPKSEAGGAKGEKDVSDEELDKLIDELAMVKEKAEPPKGGMLMASPEKPIAMYDRWSLDDEVVFEAPRKIEITDDKWPDGLASIVDLVDVVDLETGKLGRIYADKLKAAYVTATVVKPTEIVEEEPEVQEVVVVGGSGYDPADFPKGNHDWPWTEPITFRVSMTENGELDTEITFNPGGKYTKVGFLDHLTTGVGRCILWYNGRPHYLPMEDLANALPSGKEADDVVEESVDVDEGVEQVAEIHEPEKDDTEEDTEPVKDFERDSFDEEKGKQHYEKVLDLFTREGFGGYDNLLNTYNWMGDSLEFCLHEDNRKRKDYAEKLAEVLDDYSMDASTLLQLFGRQKRVPD